MELEFYIDPGDNGREVQLADFNGVGEAGALADDRVFAELLRLAPYDGSNVAKAVLPYSGPDNAASKAQRGILTPATGEVRVYPFRAIIGSRTAAGTDAKKNLRDIRSAIQVDGTNWYARVSLAANASGNPRWDLVYATVGVDVVSTGVRFSADGSTNPPTITSGSKNITKSTTITLNVLQGTPAASPTRPAIPSDSGGNYNVPLGYVRIANGFSGATPLAVNDVYEVAPVICISQAVGGTPLRPANQQYVDGGTIQTRTPWPAAGNRPGAYLPPGMVGEEKRLVSMQFGNSLTASHNNGDVVDDSIDWRNRFFRYMAQVASGSTHRLAQDPALAGSVTGCPTAQAVGLGTDLKIGLGQSMTLENQANYIVAQALSTELSAMAASSSVKLFADASTGALKVAVAGSPDCQVFFWLEASGPFANR